MARIRFKGLPINEEADISVTIGGQTANVVIPNAFVPVAASGLPRIITRNGQRATNTFSVDTSGLTGISGYEWRRINDNALLSSEPTLNGAGLAGTWVSLQVTSDQGIFNAPPLRVYMDHSDPNHNADDDALIAIVPHEEATHIAIADGNWSDAATWVGGAVPRNGAHVLIPFQRTVTYDVNERFRLDSVRVDGTLNWAIDQDTFMLTEHLIGTCCSVITIGTDNSNRLPANRTARIIISGRDYSQYGYVDTDLNLTRDPQLWGRGFISQGTVRMWGVKKLHGCLATDPVLAGATSLTLEKDPTGWELGDQVVISQTTYKHAGTVAEELLGSLWNEENEVRTITGIDGRTISWIGGLAHNHENQNPDAFRDDIRPIVMLRRGRNISIESEVTNVNWRRGHGATAHGMSVTDIWDVQFIGLGRTRKNADGVSRTRAGYIEGGQFYQVELDGAVITPVPATAQDNIIGRYPWHLHHVGFNHQGARPTLHGCFVEDTPGWGIVHHSCDADIDRCAVYRFSGAGIVSEQGNETGSWTSNICGHAIPLNETGSDQYFFRFLKGLEDNAGTRGDIFKHGYGHALTSRNVKVVDSMAFGCVFGFGYYHRGPDALGETGIQFLKNHLRSVVELPSIGRLTQSGATPQTEMRSGDHPILHFADNMAVGCTFGFGVTKGTPQQQSDYNSRFLRFTSWGHRDQGWTVEYVGNYLLVEADLVPAGPGIPGSGFQSGPGRNCAGLGANTAQIAFVNNRFQGAQGPGLTIGGGTTDNNGRGFFVTVDQFNNTDAPRWITVGNDSFNNQSDSDGTNQGNNVNYSQLQMPSPNFEDAALYTEDWDDTAFDYFREVTENLPLVLGQWNASTETMVSEPDNTDGGKSTNVHPQVKIVDKVWRDGPFIKSSGGSTAPRLKTYAQADGYYTYNGGNYLAQWEILTDEITRRPMKVMKLWEITAGEGSYTNNGALDYNAADSAVTASDLLETVAANGSIAIDVLTDASPGGGDGSTYEIDTFDRFTPDHGSITFDGPSGNVTYTPFPDFEGSDEFYVFVKSRNRFQTVRVGVLVGAGGSVTAPASPANFTVADSSLVTGIEVTFGDQPECGGRNIRLVQYSTDNGATWRRLCNLWRKGAIHVDRNSDGTAIAAGSQTIRLRYKHDHEFGASGASADVAVTVT